MCQNCSARRNRDTILDHDQFWIQIIDENEVANFDIATNSYPPRAMESNAQR